MEKPKTKNIIIPPITSPGGTISVRVTKIAPDPPVKPPWQQFMDLNVDVVQGIVGNPVVRWIVGSAIWDVLFSRKHESAQTPQL